MRGGYGSGEWGMCGCRRWLVGIAVGLAIGLTGCPCAWFGASDAVAARTTCLSLGAPWTGVGLATISGWPCAWFGASDAAAARSACTIFGTPGQDTLIGTPGRDVICAGGGPDTVFGGGGRDVLRGGVGNDVLRGNQGGDVLVAGPGQQDSLSGGTGRDTLKARDGRPFDRLDGGSGIDLCIADAEDHRVGCAHPLVASHTAPVPMLLYHAVAVAPPGAAFPQLWVPRREFAAQMRYLATHGYHVISLQDAYDYWHGDPLPSRPIIVSFDDGYRTQYRNAMPILTHHGWAGVLNLVDPSRPLQRARTTPRPHHDRSRLGGRLAHPDPRRPDRPQRRLPPGRGRRIAPIRCRTHSVSP